MRAWSSICVTLAGLWGLTGCGEPAPMNCVGFSAFRGAPSADALLLSAMGDPWIDGSSVTLDSGPQGGFMVQPVIALDPSALPAGTLPMPMPEQLCAEVAIDNIDPTGGDRFTGFEALTLSLPLRRNVITGRYESNVVFDQLRWSPLPPNTAFALSVVVRTETFAAAVMREVLLQPE